VYSVAVSPDNCHVVSGSRDKTVRIWNASTGEEEHVLRGHSDSVNSVAVSSDNRHIVSGSYGQDRSDLECVDRRRGACPPRAFCPVSSVAVSPDNRHIVSGSWDKTVRIWNMLTGEEEHVLRGHSDGGVYSVTVSPDNRHVVSGSWTRLFGFGMCRQLKRRSTEGILSRCAQSLSHPDNRHVVSGSSGQDCSDLEYRQAKKSMSS
jgi:WD40 repeat protein